MERTDPFIERESSGPIGVGVVGANPDRGWAARAHIPAIAASPRFALAAVATTREASAAAARARFGARHAFTDARELAAHPGVDLVVVTVKVPAHAELVGAALEAGKHVYCEWPLGRTAAEAAALAETARRAGVHAVAGLQARFGPAVRQARALIAAGRLGTVRSATVFSARAKGNQRDVPAWTAYTYDRTSGAGLVDVVGGHALDLVQYLLSPIRDLSARTAVRTPEHRVSETGETLVVTAPDHLLADAELDDGTVVSIQLHDGEAALPRTRIEISGTEGDLLLASAPVDDPWAAQLQISTLDLYEARPDRPGWVPIRPPADTASGLPVQAANVARLYERLATDLTHGTRTTPGFAEAQRLHELLERIS